MFTGLLKQLLKKTMVITAGVSILLGMGLINAHAAPPVSLSCGISPDPGLVKE